MEPHPSHCRTAPVVEGEEAASEAAAAAEEWTSLSNARTFPAMRVLLALADSRAHFHTP